MQKQNCNGEIFALNISKTILLIIVAALLLAGCSLTDPDPITSPARLKINLLFKASAEYNIQPDDSLFAQASDFKIFTGEKFADVFQNPDQFLAYSDSIVGFNMLSAAYFNKTVQVAFGSVPPGNYDSLLFQMVPDDLLKLNSKFYPISADYDSLGSNNFTRIVKIKHNFSLKEDHTTILNVYFNIKDNIFRVEDQFIYSAKVDTFQILNE